MEKQKTLGLLIVAILLMSMLVFFSDQGSDTEDRLGEPVLPNLKESLEELTEVRIASSGVRATLVHESGNWRVQERNGYTVNFEQLVTLLDALSEATYEEKKTAKPENFGVLHLRDIDKDSSKAVRVEAVTAVKTFELLIGAGASGRDGQFVRHPGDDQAWLVDRPVEAEADPAKWLDPSIINIPANEIVRVEMEGAGSTLEAERVDGEDSMIINNLPEDKELKFPTVADDLARALTNVRLTDVKQRPDTLPDDAVESRFHLDGGGKVVVNAWKEDKENYLAVDLNEVDDQRDNIQAWQYQVNQRTFNRFTRTMEDMVKAEDEQAGVPGAP